MQAFKAKLHEDTYYMVEQPEANDTVANVFEGAMGAAYRFRNFFIMTDNYRGIEKDRSNILAHIADFLNSTHAALNNLCIPFGSENCGFLPDSLRHEVV